MSKTIWLDQRQFVNGKNTTYDNRFNLNDFVSTTVDTSVTKLSNTVVVNSNYTATNDNYRIAANDDVTITLPLAGDVDGKTFFIIAITQNTVSIAVEGAQTINGLLSIVLFNQYEYIEVTAIGGQYYIVNSNYTPS